MAIGDSSQTRVALVPEVTLGTTPATPTFVNHRYNSETLKINRGNVTSDEIREDGNVTDLIQVSGAAAGGLSGEMSYGTNDLILESALGGAWSTNVLTNAQAISGFTIEKTIELGATDAYLRHTGMVANTFGLNVRANQIVTWNSDFLGLGGSTDTAIITGATYTAANTKAVLSAGTGFASLSAGGTTPIITGLTLNTTRNLRQQQQAGSLDAAGIGTGRFVVTGEIDAYFENATLYDLFLAGTASALSFNIGTETNEKYTFSVPKIKFSDGEVLAGGNDQDMMVRLPYQGIYDSGIGGTLRITRAVA